jgi:hypothetical protein
MEKRWNIGDSVKVFVGSNDIPSWDGKIVGTANLHRTKGISMAYLVEPVGGPHGFDLFDAGIYMGVTSAIVCYADVLS